MLGEGLMKRTRLRLALLFLCGLWLGSMPARAQGIPFYVTSPRFFGIRIICGGPWGRTSLEREIPGGVYDFHFYTAVNTIFSAYGLWDCGYYGSERRRIKFCLYDLPRFPRDVRITVNADLSASVNQPPERGLCNGTVAAGFLGDASPQRSGEGAFRVEGAAGDTVTMTLDRDGSKGSTGEVAQLRLTTEGGTVLAQQQGAVPLQLTATLPSSGRFLTQAVEVPNSAAGSGGAFRGYYTLAATDNSGNEVQLEPLPSTQP